jgi:hypothetical protein
MATTASRSRLGKVDAVIAGALCLGLGVGLVELGKLALDWPVPCQLALEKARCSALVQECIGGNIKSSLLWDGTSKSTGLRHAYRFPGAPAAAHYI